MTRQANVRLTDRVIEQWGLDLPNDRAGCELVEMTAAQEKRHDELIAAPNGGITLAADGTLAALPPPPAPPAPPDLTADRQRLYNYMPVSGSPTAQAVSAYVGNTANDPAIRATMATLRSLIRVLVNGDPNS